MRLCKSDEKRERIKWFHARELVFARTRNTFQQGLELARQCKHEDARFLVSLFPNGAAPDAWTNVGVFLAQGEEARCMCWSHQCGLWQGGVGRRQSAEAGYAWGQALYAGEAMENGDDKIAMLEEAVAQGERYAMDFLARELWACEHNQKKRARAAQLWREAALLGDPCAQERYANECCDDDLVERFVWLRRCAMQGHERGLDLVRSCVTTEMELYDKGGSGRLLFEMGGALKFWKGWQIYGIRPETVVAGQHAIALYEKCLRQARTGVMCWLGLGKLLGVAKDLRPIIALLIWDRRAAWSEGPKCE